MTETPIAPLEPPKPRTSCLPLVTFSVKRKGETTELCTAVEGPGIDGIVAGLVAAVNRANADPGEARFAHANSRQIICTEVNHAIYDRYVEEGGRNGKKALPLHAMRTFVSETEASLHIGCLNHAIAQRLCNARRAGTKEARVRGATFRYVADMDVSD